MWVARWVTVEKIYSNREFAGVGPFAGESRCFVNITPAMSFLPLPIFPPSRRPRVGVVSVPILLLTVLPVSAQTLIQFDFGSNPGAYTGTNSPGHAAGDFSGSDTTWNAVTGDTASGLLFADGSAATGVSVDVGLSSDTTTVSWTTDPGVGGPDSGIGVFATDLGNDNLFTTGGSQKIVGVRVSGLAAGTYRVYALGRGVTSGQVDYTYNQAIAVADANAATFDALGGSFVLSGLSDSGATSWVAGETHAYAQVTIGSTSDYLVFLTQATATDSASGNGFAGIPGLQIAAVSAVPEPSTWAALAGVAVLAFAAWRRRGRSGGVAT